MGIDRILPLCVGGVLGTVGCVGLFYIGIKIKRLNSTIYDIQNDIYRIRMDREHSSMNIRLLNLLEKVTVGRNKVTDEED